ncbi:hypothetical protein B0H10DRAFT_931768 [Mycena sp. CBHHK59/15]|nr:hypothetical protein B0H10DRAFT_931768 [Mycena sp. CBHHK59/15]
MSLSTPQNRPSFFPHQPSWSDHHISSLSQKDETFAKRCIASLLLANVTRSCLPCCVPLRPLFTMNRLFPLRSDLYRNRPYSSYRALRKLREPNHSSPMHTLHPPLSSPTSTSTQTGTPRKKSFPLAYHATGVTSMASQCSGTILRRTGAPRPGAYSTAFLACAGPLSPWRTGSARRNPIFCLCRTGGIIAGTVPSIACIAMQRDSSHRIWILYGGIWKWLPP